MTRLDWWKGLSKKVKSWAEPWPQRGWGDCENWQQEPIPDRWSDETERKVSNRLQTAFGDSQKLLALRIGSCVMFDVCAERSRKIGRESTFELTLSKSYDIVSAAQRLNNTNTNRKSKPFFFFCLFGLVLLFRKNECIDAFLKKCRVSVLYKYQQEIKNLFFFFF